MRLIRIDRIIRTCGKIVEYDSAVMVDAKLVVQERNAQ